MSKVSVSLVECALASALAFSVVSCVGPPAATPPIESGESAEGTATHKTKSVTDAACTAAALGDKDAVSKSLLAGAGPNAVCDSEGPTAPAPMLSLASRSGNADLVRELLARGANVDGANDAGFTALMDASYRNHLAVIAALVASGANVNQKTKEGSTALHSAAIGCSGQAVALLLRSGADPNSENDLKMTPLHDAVGRGDCIGVVVALSESGANINAAEDLFGDTPLHIASKKCKSKEGKEMIRYLLNRGANPLIANRKRETAVALASACGDPETFKMLVERARLFSGGKAPN